MKRNLIRVTLGLAAMAIILVGLESQAEAGRRNGGSFGGHGSHGGNRSFGGHGSRSGGGSFGGFFKKHKNNSCCETTCCEEKTECCEEAPKCESSCESSCDSGCDSGCDKGCGRKHKHRHSNGGCESGCDSGCGGGCNGGYGGEVIHESKDAEGSESAPEAPAEDKPAEADAPSA